MKSPFINDFPMKTSLFNHHSPTIHHRHLPVTELSSPDQDQGSADAAHHVGQESLVETRQQTWRELTRKLVGKTEDPYGISMGYGCLMRIS